MQRTGFTDFRLTKRSVITINNKAMEEACGDIKFYSLTVRAFKLGGLEDKCEDFGQTATYNGGIEDFEDEFKLDQGHAFKKGQAVKVCGNTALMITGTRFARFFTVTDPGQHKGVFQCCGNDCCGGEKQEKKEGGSGPAKKGGCC